MQAALLYGKEDLRVQEFPTPQCGDHEVLLKVSSALICGTDVRMFRHGHAGVSADSPLILGHEISGTIAQVGKQVHGYQEGQAVTVAPNMGCGICDVCVSGNTQLCEQKFDAIGITQHGGFAEYVRIPEAAVRQGNITNIPAGMSLEEAAMVEPLSCAYNGFMRCRLTPGDTVLIIGAGPIGMMHVRLAKMAGASKIYLHDIGAERLSLCQQLEPGIVALDPVASLQEQMRDIAAGRGVDVCITACSAPQAQTTALEVAALNGRVLFFGGLPADKAHVSLNTNIIHYKQLTLTGMTRSNLAQFRATLQLIAQGLLQVNDLISSRKPLAHIREMLANVSQGIGLKNAIHFD
ncbi:alcohol dehydrogenase GroES domain protein [Candidatus Moduliflexus flocculans]|uniref:Alcohol dehydrogenase GroES domain protein n=1 Tax=Candidatus Moduliflexus flocculans TaxID=1499966 RepID=A0A0S6VUG0_9BACT|nr:alcohol dehydrogenase GroES domain protein [Candidatus Moduliflexus flocculans]